jgi:signal transduction histidine kinase
MAQTREVGFRDVVGSDVPAPDRRALVDFAEDIERSLVRAGCPADEARHLATIRLVANLLCDRARDGRPLRTASGPIARAARFTGLPEAAVLAMVGHTALHDTRTVAQPPLEAVRTQLRIAASLASLREASLWLPGAKGRLECAAHAQGTPEAGTARAAQHAFATATQTSVDARRELVAVPVAREGEEIPFGALAARARRGRSGIATMALRAAAPVVCQVLRRKALVESAEARGADAAGAAERALVRFGFDVHDGPAQEIAALQSEIRGLEGQVAEAFAKDPRVELLLGRLEDLEARSAAVAEQIRALALSARSPAGMEEPVEEVLRGELGELRAAAGVEVDLELSGPVDAATPSQRIALLRGIQEALRNVREHAGARHVWLRVAATEKRIDAEVRDDGCGFDAERVRAQAPLTGRMGLAGIAERAGLIGGACEISSAKGGPTTVKISVPRWDPDRR